MKRYGSRAEVWHGNAKMTSGRLTKEHLHKNKLGRIVSKKKSLKHSKDPNKNPLLKSGLQQKKGSNTFGPLNSNKANKGNKSLKAKKNNKSKSKSLTQFFMNFKNKILG